MKTASQVNEEKMAKERAYERLTRYPDDQARAIAEHYARHAHIAMQLLRITDLQRDPINEAAKDVLDTTARNLSEIIKANHARDLGIALEWP